MTPIGDVKPGALLNADLNGADGNTLLRAGTLLSERLLQQLVRRGITHLPVRTEAETAAAGERNAAIAANLERRFRHAGDHALMQVLYAAVLAYRTGTRP